MRDEPLRPALPEVAETATTKKSTPALSEGEDFYYEGSLLVFTARYHLKRGYCCDSGCRHCPYRDTPAGPPSPERML
jgi:Family of unknown function (DUF5522)